MIPHIIHQIGPEDQTTWHPIWKTCQQSIFQAFPGVEYKLWNDQDDINRIVKKHYSEFWNLYQALPVHIMKIDFARLCILHRYGGLYLDLDYFVYKPFFDQITKHVGFVSNANLEYTSAEVENCLMFGTPNHPFLYLCLKYCKTGFILYRNRFKVSNNWRNNENSFIVNNSTGSGMLETAYKQFNTMFDFQLLDSKLFNPLPCYYSPTLFGKHFHTSIWGKEYIPSIQTSKLLIHQHRIYLINQDEKIDLEQYITLDYSEFDFYHHYCDT